MAFVGADEGLSHFLEAPGNGGREVIVDQLEHAIDTIDNVCFRDLIDLFKRSLFEFYDKLLVHRKNRYFEVRVGEFRYRSHTSPCARIAVAAFTKPPILAPFK